MKEDLTDEQIALAYRGKATLHELTNVAYGTPGWDVTELVRKGVWKVTHCTAGIGGITWHYGPV